jgi:hypothetical protein
MKSGVLSDIIPFEIKEEKICKTKDMGLNGSSIKAAINVSDRRNTWKNV